MKHRLAPDEYYKSIAKVPTSGGAIIRNSKGEFLIVQHTYNEGWHIAGGMTEQHETPRQAAIREVREELGLDIENPRAFCADFATDAPFDRILFIFDVGMLSDEQVSKIKPDPDEILAYKFVNLGDMLTLLTPALSKRVKNSFEGLLKKTCIYLENGERVS